MLSKKRAFSLLATVLFSMTLMAHTPQGLYWRNTVTGENYLHLLDHLQLIAEDYLGPAVKAPWTLVGAGDFDADGETDLFWREQSSGETAIQWLHQAKHKQFRDFIRVADAAWQVVATGDLDADQTDDLVWYNSTTGEYYLWLLSPTGLKLESRLFRVADANWQLRFARDFNGDAKADLLFRHKTSGENYLFLMNGATIQSEQPLRTVADLNWQLVAAADLNADNRADLIWRHQQTGENYAFYMNGGQQLAEVELPKVADLHWQLRVLMDLDQDGHLDQIWWNEQSYEVVALLMDGQRLVSERFLVKGAPDWQLWYSPKVKLAQTQVAQRPVLNPITPTAWLACSPEYFGGCEFEGLRQIRFGVEGKWVTQTYLNSFPGWHCSSSHFGVDPAPGQTKRCEVANLMLTGTLAAPKLCHGGTCPDIDLTAIPMGLEGSSELRVEPTEQPVNPDTDGVGAFRIICSFSHMAFDDPIVFPGQPGMSHLHAFFGNTGTNAYSTAESIAHTGNSTCVGGIANRSAYWVPALVDTRSKRAITPDEPIWYYKTGYAGVLAKDVKAMPSGLRMVAGDMNASAPQDIAYWFCREGTITHSASIPNCPVGQHVAMAIRFPQCWDGVNLDSANHKSHMAYPLASGCPSSHPVAIPEITLNLLYLVRSADAPLSWRLSSDNPTLPAGYSAHGDWFDGWEPEIRDTWVKNCEQTAKDCHAHLLGDGRTLY